MVSLRLLVLWVGLPALGLIFLGMTVYGNIRHLLFTLPPILLLSAVAFEELGLRLRRNWILWLTFAVAILPGLWGVVSLHPYEYIYMNGLAGGVSGAYGRYELDRQCTSLREGMEAANRIADVGSVIEVPRQAEDVRGYARPDLQIEARAQSRQAVDFALTCEFRPVDYASRGFSPVYTVRRGEAVLATLWRRQGTSGSGAGSAPSP